MSMNFNQNKFVIVKGFDYRINVLNASDFCAKHSNNIIETKCSKIDSHNLVEFVYKEYITNPFAYYFSIDETKDLIEIKYMDVDDTGHESWQKKFVLDKASGEWNEL